MSPWPKPETIAAALLGVACEVAPTERGPVYGLRSADPNVLLVIRAAGGPQAVCLRCTVAEAMPAAPSSHGLNGAAVPLFVPGTLAHGLFALTWLNAFSRRHEHEETR